MAVELGRILTSLEALWPIAGAESWDAPGLTTGSEAQAVSKVRFTVDVTSAVVEEAIESGIDLLVAHHPFIMRGVSSVAENTAKGATLSKAIKADLAIFAAHTNADIVSGGVSDSIARELGLSEVRPLDNPAAEIGHGRVGLLPEPMTLGDFARLVARSVPSTATGIRVSGDYSRMVYKVALCGGAGDSFIPAAINSRADVYLTSDLRHHVTQDVRELNNIDPQSPALIDVSHWASEWLWLNHGAATLRNIYPELEISVCDLRTDPWDFVITQ